MKYKCQKFSYFIYDLDMFGKRVELYFKGKSKKTSLIGIIFTLIYISIFLAFFIYKLIRMMKKTDSNFFDTYAYMEKPPSIQLSNENFYGGFALEDPISYDTFIDERIYYPKAYFKRAKRNGSDWEWFEKELEIETCKLEKFGSSFREKFKNKPLNNLYCFKEMNETLIGAFSYDLYSLFFISFYPCKNSTENGNKCKPKEEIDYYLKSTFVSFQMQDVDMTPQNYKNPILTRDKDIYTTVGKKLFKEIHAFFQIVNVETDIDIFGLDYFKDIKKETFLKYDSSSFMSSIIENDIYVTGQSFCDVTLKLSDKVLTQKRTYTKLVEILGNIGGFMQVVYSLLRIISSFSTTILYEASLVNNLFNFNLDRKIILINNKKKYTKKHLSLNLKLNSKLYIPIKHSKKLSSNFKIGGIDQSQNKINNTSLNRITLENYLVDKSPKNKELNRKPYISSSHNELKNSNKNKFSAKINLKNDDNMFKDKNDIKIFNFNMNNINYNEGKVSMKILDMKKERLIKKIKLNKICIYFCSCYFRKRKNISNILLDEGIKLIYEELDLSNIFIKLYKQNESIDNNGNNDIINMSYHCKKNLEQIYNSIINI